MNHFIWSKLYFYIKQFFFALKAKQIYNDRVDDWWADFELGESNLHTIFKLISSLAHKNNRWWWFGWVPHAVCQHSFSKKKWKKNIKWIFRSSSGLSFIWLTIIFSLRIFYYLLCLLKQKKNQRKSEFWKWRHGIYIYFGQHSLCGYFRWSLSSHLVEPV